MFTAYFDASGSEEDQPNLAVAGFISNAESWMEFEDRWLERLHRDDLAYFHTSEFNSSQGQFVEGWKDNEVRRTRLIVDLVQIIKETANRKVGMVVLNKNVQAGFSEEQRLRWHIRSYSLAGRTCAARVREWAESWHASSVPELVFEEGDSGRDELTRLLVEESGFAHPIFKPKNDRLDKHGMVVKAAVPLQASDLLAYELFDPVRKIAKDGYIRRIKRTFQELDKIPGPVGIITEDHIKLLSDYLTQI